MTEFFDAPSYVLSPRRVACSLPESWFPMKGPQVQEPDTHAWTCFQTHDCLAE